MKIRKLARFGGVALAVLGLSGVLVPDASAEGVKSVVFQGTAELNQGLDFPCAENLTPPGTVDPTTTPDLTPTKGTKTCPPQVGPGTVSKKETPFDVNGNSRTGFFRSTDCVGAWVAVGKPAPKGTGAQTDLDCIIQATFTVTGYCGLSQGRGIGTSTIGTNTIQYKFTWTDPGGGNLFILGNWWHGAPAPPPPAEPTTPPEGDIVAFVKATPLPELVGTTNTNSCVDKSAQSFTIVGDATLTHPKCLPGHETNQCPV